VGSLGVGREAPQQRDNRRIKLPEFDGSGNIDGFLARF
jgi:hypothetical protein